MIIKQQFKTIDVLILDDIKDHPGSSFEAVIKRMLAHYRARSYVQTCIHRLVSQGHIFNAGTAQYASLYIADV